MTPQELANKIDWEGGILEALEYGIHAKDIQDDVIANAWRDMEIHWLEFEKYIRYVESLLPEAK